jgi:ketosteroid isomerase-like protein
MAETNGMADRSGADVLRALWLAHREGRIDDVLALVHPDVVWHPLTRPGLSLYRGHDGARAMLADLRSALGEFYVEFDEYDELADGRVVCRGHIVRSEREPAVPSFECVATFLDGLLVGFESTPRSD